MATATATERRGLSADADASTPFARFRALTQADAEQDGSGSRDSPAVEAETRPGVVNLDKSEATTQALPQRVLSAAAADEPESQGQAWLEQGSSTKHPPFPLFPARPPPCRTARSGERFRATTLTATYSPTPLAGLPMAAPSRSAAATAPSSTHPGLGPPPTALTRFRSPSATTWTDRTFMASWAC